MNRPFSNYSIGIDFGTDSVRALIVDISTGQEISTAVIYYPRWKQGKYCNPAGNQFRQHPLDYIEGLEQSVKEALAKAPEGIGAYIKGIAVDTTGSTPVAVDSAGKPLALNPGFEENPNAMFVLWKDHTAIREAEEINRLCAGWDINYTQYEGGIYSSEWFWAKILHVMRNDEKVRQAAFSWVEHCDWIPFLLTGGNDANQIKRSRCAAGHKAMWHESWGGLPPEEFWLALDPVLKGMRSKMYTDTYTSDIPAGKLSSTWAARLGLSTDTIVAVGAFDAHMGAVGGYIEPYHLSKIMGTSTCDILIAPKTDQEKLVKGICGQVNGSVMPDMLGLEAGQSAFGDVFAWFKSLLAWPIEKVITSTSWLTAEQKEKLIEEALESIIPALTKAAEELPAGVSDELALDWFNGRRTPDANQLLKGAITGLNLGSDAPKIFRALVESTCFGARLIVERFEQEGVPIHGVIGLGGVAKKSAYVMQVLADVLNRPIRIARSEQTCALGAAMFAATAAGLFHNVHEAMLAMHSGFDAEYFPRPETAKRYNNLYKKYVALGNAMETFTTTQKN